MYFSLKENKIIQAIQTHHNALKTHLYKHELQQAKGVQNVTDRCPFTTRNIKNFQNILDTLTQKETTKNSCR